MADNLENHEPEAFETAQPTSSLNHFHTVWRHKWLVLLGVVGGCVMGAIFYSRAAPIYQSSALVLVVKKGPEALPLPGSDTRPTYTEDYLSTHQTLIRSAAIVGQAVQKAKLGGLKSFAGSGDPTEEIIRSLKVSREMNAGSPTSILNISYRGSDAEDCAGVVKAVIESYQQFLGSRYKNVNDETTKLITEANEILEKKLNNKQKEYDKFSLENPNLWKGKDGVSIVHERLAGLEARRSALVLQQTEIQGRLDAMEKLVKDGRYSRADLVAMIAQTASRPGTENATATAALEERLLALELQEKSLQENYARDYPPLREVHNQVTMLRTLMEKRGKAADDAAGGVDPVKNHLQGLQLDLENTRMATEALARLIEKEQNKAKESRSIEKQDESYRAEIARHLVLFEAVAKRLDEVSILKNFAGGYEADTIAPPKAGKMVYPSLTLVFSAAGILGLLAGLGLVYLAELADQSFRTPEEIRRRLGLPVVGHIPNFGPKEGEALPVAVEESQFAPTLCTVHYPKSRESESYRGVRTALFFSSRAEGIKVVQVTSADMGDGKSTLVANLAVSIAQAEKKVIVIDADFRRPRQHKLFNVPGKQGLASVITGDAELKDVIQPTAIPGLFVLPCGPIPSNPAELLTLNRFQETVAAIREQFDFVIIDTPPLLAVTDPCIVVPHVDSVLLTVRITKDARPHAYRAKEILATLGAKVLGVVVNGVDPSDKGYGYTYRYSYYYKTYYNNNEKDDAAAAKVNGEAPGEDRPKTAPRI